MLDIQFKVGQKIWFSDLKRPYTVRACNSRFAVCTQPFNLQKTVMYTIIDIDKRIRGTENLVFCMGFETDEQCENALERLTCGDSEVSRRNFVGLDIVKVK